MAFAQFHKKFRASEYWLIGDGREYRNLNQMVEKFGVMDRVRFWGNLPRQQVIEKLTECDVLVHPSVHDSAPAVCLEAMVAGRPVICLDLGGPALQVTEETGIKVPTVSPEQVVNDLAEAMCFLARDPDLRKRMAEAARRRVKEYFDWNKKGEWMNNLYQKVFGQHNQ